jgi:hypothetical protein
MQRLIKFLFASAMIIGLVSTIAASAHPTRHPDVVRAGHFDRAAPVDQSHWLI